MSVDRGYRTGKKGKGAGGKKPARAVCPCCTKKGVGQWKATEFGVIRDCQYCLVSWTKESWASQIASNAGEAAIAHARAQLSAQSVSAVQPVAWTVDELAQEIRRVDGNHSLGAGALAEALMPFHAHPADADAVDAKEKT